MKQQSSDGDSGLRHFGSIKPKTSRLTKSSQGWPELLSQVWPGFDTLYRTKETDRRTDERHVHLNIKAPGWKVTAMLRHCMNDLQKGNVIWKIRQSHSCSTNLPHIHTEKTLIERVCLMHRFTHRTIFQAVYWLAMTLYFYRPKSYSRRQ